jgi:hypothetical protein
METSDALTWRKSSYSTSNGGNCVEVAAALGTIAVRDSKDPNGPALIFNRTRWQEFSCHLRMINNAELDRDADR